MSYTQNGHDSISIVSLDCHAASELLLKQESYCSLDLPPYFKFSEIIDDCFGVLRNNDLLTLTNAKPSDFDNVNHRILKNKDGKYAWRPMELIHPALYVSLVQNITNEEYWNLIKTRFAEFANSDHISCLSLPVESSAYVKNTAAQVHQWWEQVELRSIELSLDYEFIMHTDIVDCYPAIYTHSIAWALHTKHIAKRDRFDNDLIGNRIDRHIRDMCSGQTNGIPQGSVLMDFIAEMVLGYADTELLSKVAYKTIDFKILRYRDDYRVFVNNPYDGEFILKCLTEVLVDLGLKLGPDKTNFSSEVVKLSFKDDKLDWMFRRQSDRSLHKHLMIIHDHAMVHPNSGSVHTGLLGFHKRLLKRNTCKHPKSLIAIVVDIAFRNPRTYAVSAAILSKLVSFIVDTEEKREIISRIIRKFTLLPNTGYMRIWLQRISLGFGSDLNFNEPLCGLLNDSNTQIWNNDWISSRELLESIETGKIVDQEELLDTTPVVSVDEVSLFSSNY